MEMVMSFLPLIVIFGIFWFMFIRPQRKRQEEYQDMLSNLERGDKVYTRGGIKGTITQVQDDKLELRISPQVNVELKRNGIAELADESKNEAGSEEGEDKEKEEVKGKTE